MRINVYSQELTSEVCMQHTGMNGKERVIASVGDLVAVLQNKKKEKAQRALDRIIKYANKLNW